MYSGHRAIYLQEFDYVGKKLVGPRNIIVNGGVKFADHPVWIEGPHMFRKDGWYYLICAEGGTGEQHSEVVFRSRTVAGPYLPGPGNPILTQRTLRDARPNPVTCTGHAELVEADNGEWWSVFLGCRPYEGGMYNTGRETFMLPVTWADGWPSILPPGISVPFSVGFPHGVSVDAAASTPLTGNFTWRDDFKGPAFSKSWIGVRVMPEANFGTGYLNGLLLVPGNDPLWGNGSPAFVGHRIQHTRFTASTYLKVPASNNISAGIVAFQNESHHYFFGIHQTRQGLEVFVERLNGGSPEKIAHVIEEETTRIKLQIACDGARCDFGYSATPGSWSTLLSGADATLLSTQVAGGFVGAVVGLHARIDP
jgi:alpha-N-arabinofuranosidase